MTETEALVKEQIQKHEKRKEDFDPEALKEESNKVLFAKHLQKALSQEVFGQDQAILTIANSVKNDTSNPKSPKMTYLFLGPPATGKSHLAELLAKLLPKYRSITFDMTQYHQQNGGELYGYPSGWKGYGVGRLTGFVYRNPKSVIILDSFDKCDNVIQNNLLSIFEGGRMRDACGWDKVTDEPCNEDPDIIYNEENANYWVDFTETIFIITTSLGRELYSDHRFKDLVQKDYIQAESMILEAIKRETKRDNRSGGEQEAIVPELVSRFSKAHIVLFNKLEYDSFEKIGLRKFQEFAQDFETRYNVVFRYDKHFEGFLKLQILNFAPELDARRIEEKIGTHFFNKITTFFQELEKGFDAFKEIRVLVPKKVKSFIQEHIDPLIAEEKLARELFRKNRTLELDEELSFHEGVLTYKVKSCRLKQIIRIKDFSEDGLVFDIPRVSFEDIAGHSHAKQRLREVINFFKEPQKLRSFDIDPPKGMLLYGPPGTGKTMLAKAFAHEAELPFIAVTGLDLLSPKKTHQIFQRAKEYAPSIIFIDEIDTIGKREEGNGKEIPINKLLAEMDGFSSKSGEEVFVIAATNFKENIDEAVLRPGRIEIHIEVNSLDKEAREYFLRRIIRTKPTKGRFDMKKLLSYTVGFTGAQLELLGKEASYYCLRHGIEGIDQHILVEQINTIKFGKQPFYPSIDKMSEKTALYEAAKALISKYLMPRMHIEHIALIPEENRRVRTVQDGEGVYEHTSLSEFKDRVTILMSGRTALVEIYGTDRGIDTSACEDIKEATKEVYAAIAYYGMDEDVGFINVEGVSVAQEGKAKGSSHECYHAQIDHAMQKWMDEARQNARDIVRELKDEILQLQQILIDEEILYADRLDSICQQLLKRT